MKNHETESSIFSELCDNIENETKAKIKTNEDIGQLGIGKKLCVVTTMCFVTNSLKNYLQMLKPLPVSSNPAP